MATQTYCTREDIESVWTPTAVLHCADDDLSGTLSPTEEQHIARAIERAAGIMNGLLEVRYDLADLVASTWCRDCNAALAAYLLAIRRDEDLPAGIVAEYARYLRDLAEIRAGQQRVPQVIASDRHAPTVSNFAIDLRQSRAKVRRVRELSTGDAPPPTLLQYPETD